MKTLIELYDERPIENVLAADVFCPERVVYLCPEEVARNMAVQEKIREYFSHRGLTIETIFIESSLFYAQKVRRQLGKIQQQYPDCVVDITGGTDAALFAAGEFCTETDTPAFTYSRKKNRFFNIHNAEFAENLKFDANYMTEDFFLMAGGAMRHGRVNNSEIDRHADVIDRFFSVYLANKRNWVPFVTWMQRASAEKNSSEDFLKVNCAYTQPGERNGRLKPDLKILRSLSGIGMIKGLHIKKTERISFAFADAQIRTWLRDVGAVLEIFIYKACKDAGIFQDVCCSAIVEWVGMDPTDKVSNEIDVVAVKGVIPVFISCKTCAVETYALNELAILRDRFGGESAKAIIVTCEKCSLAARQRAEALDICVIDLSDLQRGNISGKIKALAE